LFKSNVSYLGAQVILQIYGTDCYKVLFLLRTNVNRTQLETSLPIK